MTRKQHASAGNRGAQIEPQLLGENNASDAISQLREKLRASRARLERAREAKTPQSILTLDDIRQVFPSARIISNDDECDKNLQLQRDVVPPPPSETTVKKCVTCGAFYKGWAHSEYCGNNCAEAGHRVWATQGNNPSKKDRQILKALCRGSSQRADEGMPASESFAMWLRNFEARIERLKQQQLVQLTNETDDEIDDEIEGAQP